MYYIACKAGVNRKNEAVSNCPCLDGYYESGMSCKSNFIINCL